MICSNCGQEVNKGLRFCTKCGSKIVNITIGKNLLQVTGILFIIFGVIGVISSISFILINSNMANDKLDFDVKSDIIMPILRGIILSILNIIIGIFGFKYSKNIKKAKFLLCFAIILIVIQIISLIIGYLILSEFSLFQLIVFIIPICFMIGAYINLKNNGGK